MMAFANNAIIPATINIQINAPTVKNKKRSTVCADETDQQRGPRIPAPIAEHSNPIAMYNRFGSPFSEALNAKMNAIVGIRTNMRINSFNRNNDICYLLSVFAKELFSYYIYYTTKVNINQKICN